MDYLARNDSPISEELWEQIDSTVIAGAKQHMVCRRFLPLYGPLGAGASYVPVDGKGYGEALDGNLGRRTGRNLLELPMLYQDFTLYWRDVAEAEKNGLPLDLSAVARAAQKSAKQEDDFLLFGDKTLGHRGLFNADGAHKIKRSDWSVGEGPHTDVAHGIAYFAGNGMLGRYALILSPNLYLQLQRLEPNVGLLEIDRVKKLVQDRVYPVGDFSLGKAALICAEPQYVDMAVGLDLSVGYLGQSDLNHPFRIMETVALRIKDPQAIVIFE